MTQTYQFRNPSPVDGLDVRLSEAASQDVEKLVRHDFYFVLVLARPASMWQAVEITNLGGMPLILNQDPMVRKVDGYEPCLRFRRILDLNQGTKECAVVHMSSAVENLLG